MKIFTVKVCGYFRNGWVPKLKILSVDEVNDRNIPPPPISKGMILSVPANPDNELNILLGIVVCDTYSECEIIVNGLEEYFIKSTEHIRCRESILSPNVFSMN